MNAKDGQTRGLKYDKKERETKKEEKELTVAKLKKRKNEFGHEPLLLS